MKQLNSVDSEDDRQGKLTAEHLPRRIEMGCPSATKTLQITIAATFTADVLKLPLDFWMKKLEIESSITLAPYAQVMQELLNPESMVSRNRHGFNVLLIRLEDWVRDRRDQRAIQNLSHIIRVADDFALAVETLRSRTSAGVLIFLCPSSSSLPVMYGQAIAEMERTLVKRLGAVDGVHSTARPSATSRMA